MQQVVTHSGTFRATPFEWGVGQTANGYPQFSVALQITEHYDFDEQEWVDYTEYDCGITAYLVLFGKDNKPLRNFDQVKKVFGWDGTSFSELNNGDYENLQLQVRVVDDEYEGKSRLKVNWIDEHDATPGARVGQINKLDADKLKTLDAEFKSILTQASGGKQPAKAPAKKPTPLTPPAKEKADESQPPKKGKRGRPKGSPNKKSPPKPPAAKKKEKEKADDAWTLQRAWDHAFAHGQENGYEDDDICEAWADMREANAPEVEDADMTSEQWQKIAEDTVKELTPH